MTEIRKANELAKMVKEFKASEKERIEKEVNEIVINIVEKILVPKAKEGKSTVFINCDKHRDAVISVLRENGYICDRCNDEIRIRW